ncbi:MAG: aspartate--tRNA ligase [Planctomycetota bacterium]
MASWQRTHTCGELRVGDAGKTVVLNGWVENRRDHGGVLFLDLRDRYGTTQVVVDDQRQGVAAGLLERATRLGAEDCVAIAGEVVTRDPDKVNPGRATGEVELVAHEVTIFSEADTPPFEIVDEAEANEELRMRKRFLDLRRRPMQSALIQRSKLVQAVRSFLASQGFVEVETPVLTKSTPEGARDYLVPSRVNPGSFYALPQSPQIFKQLMMISGLDRYYQIARCFRDEDLRADRQPEFSQIDLEMSFVEEDDVLDLVEGMVVAGFRDGLGVEVPRPFPRLDYADAQRRYGSDKPDLRFELELIDVSELAGKSDFKVFAQAIADGGQVKGLCVPGQAENFSRKDIDGLTAHVGEYGARGLAWAKITADGVTGSIAKFFGGAAGDALIEATGAAAGDLLLFVADRTEVVHRALGALRVRLGAALGLRDPKEFRFCWVTSFPMFEFHEERGTWDSAHHPFTAPDDWELEDYSKDTAKIRSRAYDLVLNGWELGSGSIRIHRPDVQQRVFEFLGISEEEQQSKFGFLLDAMRYGAPPHGGIALGLDRLIAMALGHDSIRDVIAFPKTTSAQDLMCEAPSTVAPEQLAELHIMSQAPKKP